MAQVQYSSVQQAHCCSYKSEAHEDQQRAHGPSTIQYSTVQYSRLTVPLIRIKHMKTNREHIAQVHYSTVQQAHSSSYKNKAHEDQQGTFGPRTLQYSTAGSLLFL
jgi:hypothetical protein